MDVITENEWAEELKDYIRQDMKVENKMIKHSLKIDPVDSTIPYIHENIKSHSENIINNFDYFYKTISRKEFYPMIYYKDEQGRLGATYDLSSMSIKPKDDMIR